MLRQFPASQRHVAKEIDPSLNVPYCKNRFGDDVAEHAKEIADRCPANFVWWDDPYQIRTACDGDARVIEPPTGYLLPYWMGRYYGFIVAGD